MRRILLKTPTFISALADFCAYPRLKGSAPPYEGTTKGQWRNDEERWRAAGSAGFVFPAHVTDACELPRSAPSKANKITQITKTWPNPPSCAPSKANKVAQIIKVGKNGNGCRGKPGPAARAWRHFPAISPMPSALSVVDSPACPAAVAGLRFSRAHGQVHDA